MRLRDPPSTVPTVLWLGAHKDLSVDSERHCLAPARVAGRSAIVIGTSLVREAAEKVAPLSINKKAAGEKAIDSLTTAPTP